MSKFCPISQTYTNCTDCCDACLDEERKNKMNELIDKIHAEQREYLERIAELSPREIIEKAYEICWREEFIIYLETEQFDDETLEILLGIDYVLDVLYDEWSKSDILVEDMIKEVVSDFVYDESNK